MKTLAEKSRAEQGKQNEWEMHTDEDERRLPEKFQRRICCLQDTSEKFKD